MIDPASVAERIKKENQREAQELAQRRQHAQNLGKYMANQIILRYPEVRRVWGFGSTYETWRSYRSTSDIDLALEGGDVLEIFRITEGCEIPIDLVSLEDCPPSMAAAIRSHGVILAEVPCD